MAVTITIDDEAVIAHLRMLPDKVRLSLRRAVVAQSIGVQARVREKLAGQVLKERTHHLHDSIHYVLTKDDSTGIVSTVGTDIAYAAYHEFGFSGTEDVREHMRRQSVAFGQPITPVEVLVRAHTRQVDYAGHPFLRPTLEEMAPQIRAALEQAVKEGLQ